MNTKAKINRLSTRQKKKMRGQKERDVLWCCLGSSIINIESERNVFTEGDCNRLNWMTKHTTERMKEREGGRRRKGGGHAVSKSRLHMFYRDH